MKKLLLTTLLLLVLLCATACVQKAQCSFCGEEHYCTTKIVGDQKVTICPDCSQQWNEMRP